MIKKTNKKRQSSAKASATNRGKWQPRRIELYPKKVLSEDGENLIQMLSELLFKMNQSFRMGVQGT